MTSLQWRWLLYAVLIAAPALIAWEDLFLIVAVEDTRYSLLRTGTVSSYLIFATALVLPLLYVGVVMLRTRYGSESRQARVINLLYLFAALGYIIDAITFAAYHNNTGDEIVYLWALFLMMVYLPVVTSAAVILTPTRPTLGSRPNGDKALS